MKKFCKTTTKKIVRAFAPIIRRMSQFNNILKLTHSTKDEEVIENRNCLAFKLAGLLLAIKYFGIKKKGENENKDEEGQKLLRDGEMRQLYRSLEPKFLIRMLSSPITCDNNNNYVQYNQLCVSLLQCFATYPDINQELCTHPEMVPLLVRNSELLLTSSKMLSQQNLLLCKELLTCVDTLVSGYQRNHKPKSKSHNSNSNTLSFVTNGSDKELFLHLKRAFQHMGQTKKDKEKRKEGGEKVVMEENNKEKQENANVEKKLVEDVMSSLEFLELVQELSVYFNRDQSALKFHLCKTLSILMTIMTMMVMNNTMTMTMKEETLEEKETVRNEKDIGSLSPLFWYHIRVGIIAMLRSNVPNMRNRYHLFQLVYLCFQCGKGEFVEGINSDLQYVSSLVGDKNKCDEGAMADSKIMSSIDCSKFVLLLLHCLTNEMRTLLETKCNARKGDESKEDVTRDSDYVDTVDMVGQCLDIWDVIIHLLIASDANEQSEDNADANVTTAEHKSLETLIDGDCIRKIQKLLQELMSCLFFYVTECRNECLEQILLANGNDANKDEKDDNSTQVGIEVWQQINDDTNHRHFELISKFHTPLLERVIKSLVLFMMEEDFLTFEDPFCANLPFLLTFEALLVPLSVVTSQFFAHSELSLQKRNLIMAMWCREEIFQQMVTKIHACYCADNKLSPNANTDEDEILSFSLLLADLCEYNSVECAKHIHRCLNMLVEEKDLKVYINDWIQFKKKLIKVAKKFQTEQHAWFDYIESGMRLGSICLLLLSYSFFLAKAECFNFDNEKSITQKNLDFQFIFFNVHELRKCQFFLTLLFCLKWGKCGVTENIFVTRFYHLTALIEDGSDNGNKFFKGASSLNLYIFNQALSLQGWCKVFNGM
ncbi:hypothetical protein RFI_21601 [Reticulomyxa filosa]|uniref:Uncharacterized protein n=1 Tax=Reticulomyxa filosa TaxID=46433 RepID=X6MRN9_RETFI|nr:hypothetical protein RFI_21601 [Reticulomyxa filosa]|eukprot:ETO15765.1 hypothetical protein RFI_21601 [Reticulomyxa filosa]